MKVLVILNDAPYGIERPYNALRLALALARHDDVVLRVFLLGDAVACAKSGQKTPEGSYSIERMVRGLTSRGVEVGACGSCLDARGHGDADLIDGVCRSSMPELAAWTLWADRAVTF